MAPGAVLMAISPDLMAIAWVISWRSQAISSDLMAIFAPSADFRHSRKRDWTIFGTCRMLLFVSHENTWRTPMQQLLALMIDQPSIPGILLAMAVLVLHIPLWTR